mmetsp:Transcript_139992/g.314318  ORF Transcript_139992/g.314318 Transcript_139992/m.314318 type:complete len:317 (-) Transcript_139992:91-1041(-)
MPCPQLCGGFQGGQRASLRACSGVKPRGACNAISVRRRIRPCHTDAARPGGGEGEYAREQHVILVTGLDKEQMLYAITSPHGVKRFTLSARLRHFDLGCIPEHDGTCGAACSETPREHRSGSHPGTLGGQQQLPRLRNGHVFEHGRAIHQHSSVDSSDQRPCSFGARPCFQGEGHLHLRRQIGQATGDQGSRGVVSTSHHQHSVSGDDDNGAVTLRLVHLQNEIHSRGQWHEVLGLNIVHVPPVKNCDTSFIPYPKLGASTMHSSGLRCTLQGNVYRVVANLVVAVHSTRPHNGSAVCDGNQRPGNTTERGGSNLL